MPPLLSPTAPYRAAGRQPPRRRLSPASPGAGGHQLNTAPLVASARAAAGHQLPQLLWTSAPLRGAPAGCRGSAPLAGRSCPARAQLPGWGSAPHAELSSPAWAQLPVRGSAPRPGLSSPCGAQLPMRPLAMVEWQLVWHRLAALASFRPGTTLWLKLVAGHAARVQISAQQQAGLEHGWACGPGWLGTITGVHAQGHDGDACTRPRCAGWGTCRGTGG